MKEEPVCCCKCKEMPQVKCEAGDLWYVFCHCGKWNRYEALGSTYNGAVRHWNDLNRMLTRKGNPRNEGNF